MVFKKYMNTEGAPYVIGQTVKNDENLFPPGFTYKLDGILYTVREDVTVDSASPMRRVTTSEGSTEILEISIILKDLQSAGAMIIEDPSLKEEAEEMDDKTELGEEFVENAG